MIANLVKVSKLNVLSTASKGTCLNESRPIILILPILTATSHVDRKTGADNVQMSSLLDWATRCVSLRTTRSGSRLCLLLLLIPLAVESFQLRRCYLVNRNRYRFFTPLRGTATPAAATSMVWDGCRYRTLSLLPLRSSANDTKIDYILFIITWLAPFFVGLRKERTERGRHAHHHHFVSFLPLRSVSSEGILPPP